MEKLRKDLFQDKTIEERRRVHAGACLTSVGGTVTRCCTPAGCIFADLGQ